MNAHELIAKIARMTDPVDADDNALTLARLIGEARTIAAFPPPVEETSSDLTLDDLAQIQMGLSLAISWWGRRPRSQFGRNEVLKYYDLIKRLDPIIDGHCAHQYTEDGPECECGNKRFVLTERGSNG